MCAPFVGKLLGHIFSTLLDINNTFMSQFLSTFVPDIFPSTKWEDLTNGAQFYAQNCSFDETQRHFFTKWRSPAHFCFALKVWWNPAHVYSLVVMIKCYCRGNVEPQKIDLTVSDDEINGERTWTNNAEENHGINSLAKVGNDWSLQIG